MLTLNINGTEHSVEAEPDTPLLWVLRDELALTGTKFGCGAGLCGACTVLLAIDLQLEHAQVLVTAKSSWCRVSGSERSR